MAKLLLVGGTREDPVGREIYWMARVELEGQTREASVGWEPHWSARMTRMVPADSQGEDGGGQNLNSSTRTDSGTASVAKTERVSCKIKQKLPHRFQSYLSCHIKKGVLQRRQKYKHTKFLQTRSTAFGWDVFRVSCPVMEFYKTSKLFKAMH